MLGVSWRCGCSRSRPPSWQRAFQAMMLRQPGRFSASSPPAAVFGRHKCGGLLFRHRMVLARGCASRLLVLAAGNTSRVAVRPGVRGHRPVRAGRVTARCARRSARGGPSRARPATCWRGSAPAHLGGLVIRCCLAGPRGGVGDSPPTELVGLAQSIGVGLMVAAGWWFLLPDVSTRLRTDRRPESLLHRPSGGFADESADPPDQTWNFDLGLVPGVSSAPSSRLGWPAS